MRLSTLLTYAALGAVGYYAYRLATERARTASVTLLRTEPIVMWFEDANQRSAYCEGAD